MKLSLIPALVLTLMSIPAHGQELLLTNVALVSPERQMALANQNVLVSNGQITRIDSNPLLVPDTTKIIDGTGKFLTPGLIDSHVHLYHATGLKRRYSKDYVRLYDDYMTQMPRSYLYHGYTSLIELNADFDTNQRVAASAPKPEVYHCGQGLVLSNDFMATEFDSAEEFFAAFPNFLHDRFTTPELPAGIDPAEHTPAATVTRIAAAGGRCVKLYYEEALWWPGERPEFSLPSVAIVREVVSEAHQRGMTVVLHATTPNGQRFALATGVDVLGHGLWEWPGIIPSANNIPADIAALTDEVAHSELRLQPTVQTIRNELSLGDPDFLDNPALRKVLPADYLHYLRTDAQVQRAEFEKRIQRIAPVLFPELDMSTFDHARFQHHFIARYEQLIGYFERQGGRLLFGTDTAVGGLGWGNPPGLNGFWEMRAWQQAGIPLATILHAATLGNAEAFGIAGELGSIAVGKRANLLLLDANPLQTLDAWNQIDTVILGGKPIARESLSAERVRPAG